jgi:hypothetical protein
MMAVWVVYLCATVFFVTGLLELTAFPRGSEDIAFARSLCAFGFWTFGARVFYLAWVGDVERLHFLSMGALVTICIGRIIINVRILRETWHGCAETT